MCLPQNRVYETGRASRRGPFRRGFLLSPPIIEWSVCSSIASAVGGGGSAADHVGWLAGPHFVGPSASRAYLWLGLGRLPVGLLVGAGQAAEAALSLPSPSRRERET